MDRLKTITLIIDSSLENVSMIGTSIFSLLKLFKFTEIQSNRIEVAVVESVTNSIRHSYQNKPGNPIELTFTISSSCLTIDIIDCGIPIDPEKIKPVLNFDPADISTITEGGMGLYLIYKIMDEVIITQEKGKNIWRLIKNINQKKDSKE